MPAVTLKNVEELSDDIRAIVEGYDAWVGDTVFARVLSHVPEPFKAFNNFYEVLLNGHVESEIKELSRMKMAKLNDCEY